jgi:hypothetical protein
MHRSVFSLAGLVLCLSLLGVGARAASLTWTGGGADSNWFNSANWSGSGNYPQDGDYVSIPSGYVFLTNSTARLASFSNNAPNVVFSNWTTVLYATNIVIQSSGVLTHSPCDTNAAIGNTNRVAIRCVNLTVLGSINANGKGYRGGVNAGIFGQGPGAARDEAGASYGGIGGGPAARRGPTYGSLTMPSDPGSGGGGRAVSEQGDAGGGSIWIEADGHVLVNGTISADGEEPGYMGNRGGGSGGSLYISCNTFASTNGNLRAEGSDVGDSSGHTGNGGGGGRVAVVYNNTAQQTLNLTQRPLVNVYLKGGFGYNGTRSGMPGTLYMPDASFFPGTNNVLRGCQLMIDGFTSWAPDSLTINAGLVVLPEGFVLSVTNDLLLTGTGAGFLASNASVSVGRDLQHDTITPSWFYCGTGTILTVSRDLVVGRGAFNWYGGLTNKSRLPVGRNCLLTNGGSLYLNAGLSNGVAPHYGAWFTVVGNLVAYTNSWLIPVSHWTNGGSVYIEARNVAANLGGGINADVTGFGSPLWGSGLYKGYGPGGGTSSGGGGYGGNGGSPGTGGSGSAGSSNGLERVDLIPGSGGGTYGGYAGGRGGGLVWLTADTVTVDGDIRARGNVTATSPYDVDVGGGGAGGGIYIRCVRFAGAATGRLLATGGVPHYERSGAQGGGGGGSGGGGRIAVWRKFDTYSGTISIVPGQAYDALRTGLNGTVYWGDSRKNGTVISVK